MKKLQLLSASVFALAALSACSDNSEEFKLETQTVSKVDFTINDFEGDEVSTRTVYGKDGQVAWKAGDVIGVFPFADAEGNQPLSKSQVDFYVTKGTASAKTLVFDGGSWALRENWTYLAYYPFNTNNRIDSWSGGIISGDYGTLTQIGNDNIQHIAEQDYLRSKAATVKNGTVNFEMEHISSILKLNLTLQDAEDVEVTSLSVKTDSYGFVRRFDYFINRDDYGYWGDQTVSLNFDRTRTNGTNLVAYIPVCSLKKINSNERWTITAITEKGALKGTFEPNISTSTFTAGTIYSLKATLVNEKPTSITVGVNPIEAGCTLLEFIPDSTGLYKIGSSIRIDYSFLNNTYQIDSNYFFEEGKSYILSLDDSHDGGTVTITQQTSLKLGENNGLTAQDFYTFTAPYDGLFGWENCDFWDCPNSTINWLNKNTILLNKGQIAIFRALNSTVVIKKADMTTIKNLNDKQTVSQEQIFSFVPEDDGYYFIGTVGDGRVNPIGSYDDYYFGKIRLSKGQELRFSASPYGEDFKIWIEKVTPETLNLDQTTSVTKGNLYEFVPESDGFYRIVKEGEGYCYWDNVPSYNYCAYLREGESALLKTSYNCNDLKITLTNVDTQLEFGKEHIETTQGEYFYTFVPGENGIYQVDVNNGYGIIIVDNVGAEVAKLEQGVEYLVFMNSRDNPTTIRILSAQSKQIKAVGDPLTFENQERYLVQFTPSKSGFYWIESKDCGVRWLKDAWYDQCAYLESGNTYSFAASPWSENASVTVKQPVDIASTDSQFAVNNGVNYYTFTPNQTGTYRFEANCSDVDYCYYQDGVYYWVDRSGTEFTIEDWNNRKIHIIRAESYKTETQQGKIVLLNP